MTTLTIAPGPTNATTDPRTGLRHYTWKGQSYPSVTSIRRLAGVPHGLVQWQLSKVAKRATEQYDTLTEMLTRERRPRERALEANRIEEAARWLRQAATEERDRSAALGTAVHDAAASGKHPDDVDDAIRPRLLQYLDWLQVSGAEIIGAEFQCWSPSVGYAGTCDLLCRFPSGALHVVDLKTGGSIYPEYALQLVAYAMADFVGTDDEVDHELTDALHAHTGQAVLHLSDDGWEYAVLRTGGGAWDAFRGLLTFASWMASHADAASVISGSRKSHEGDMVTARIAAKADELRRTAA